MKQLEERFLGVRMNVDSAGAALHKPLLLLFALGKLLQGRDRMIPFSEIDAELSQLFRRFYPAASQNSNTHYPFGKLENDGIWEVERSANLKRTSVGHLFKTELLSENICGGFTLDVFAALCQDKVRAWSIAKQIVSKFFEAACRDELLEAVGISVDWVNAIDNVHDASFADYRTEIVPAIQQLPREKEIGQNGFIPYLNSLHNLQAGGANALAESQALSPYFGELYVPLPLIDTLTGMLSDGVERVVVLTGHAGDGKSTVALDVLKKFRGLPPTEPLSKPLDEREGIVSARGPITVVKDMSELSAERRQRWLRQAFTEPGSWLIVSNTGPLLDSLAKYAKGIENNHGVESEILDRLDQPLGNDLLDKHSLDRFGKELLILNLTRLDNVEIGAEILARLVKHSGWGQCAGCNVEQACPLVLNRKALSDAGAVAEERVRWIYRRLSAYEQRLTLRQIVAQFAFGLTGGLGCVEAREQVMTSTAQGIDRGSAALERILFSEGFFGFCAGKPWPKAKRLRAVALTQRVTFGAPVGADFERRLADDAGIGWAVLPSSLADLSGHWRQRAAEAAGVRWRFALRRMAYLFGTVIPGKEQPAGVFLDAFLQSPSLRQLDQWQMAGKLTLSNAETRRLRTSCLQVLLEAFSGFSAGQFKSKHDALYLTVRRQDRAVFQPTQLVLTTLPFQDFDLRYDRIRGLPVLSFDRGRAELVLTLPLLDYIRRRDAGELGNQLAPIHQAELDRFQAALLQATVNSKANTGEIELLRAGIDGEVHLHRFILDREKGRLELV